MFHYQLITGYGFLLMKPQEIWQLIGTTKRTLGLLSVDLFLKLF